VPGEPGFRVCKLLSVDPSNYDDAPREGIRRILEEVRRARHRTRTTAHAPPHTRALLLLLLTQAHERVRR
jgi:hypothetical protein